MQFSAPIKPFGVTMLCSQQPWHHGLASVPAMLQKLLLAGDLPMKKRNYPIITGGLDSYIACEPDLRKSARQKARC